MYDDTWDDDFRRDSRLEDVPDINIDPGSRAGSIAGISPGNAPLPNTTVVASGGGSGGKASSRKENEQRMTLLKQLGRNRGQLRKSPPGTTISPQMSPTTTTLKDAMSELDERSDSRKHSETLQNVIGSFSLSDDPDDSVREQNKQEHTRMLKQFMSDGVPMPMVDESGSETASRSPSTSFVSTSQSVMPPVDDPNYSQMALPHLGQASPGSPGMPLVSPMNRELVGKPPMLQNPPTQHAHSIESRSTQPPGSAMENSGRHMLSTSESLTATEKRLITGESPNVMSQTLSPDTPEAGTPSSPRVAGKKLERRADTFLQLIEFDARDCCPVMDAARMLVNAGLTEEEMRMVFPETVEFANDSNEGFVDFMTSVSGVLELSMAQGPKKKKAQGKRRLIIGRDDLRERVLAFIQTSPHALENLESINVEEARQVGAARMVLDSRLRELRSRHLHADGTVRRAFDILVAITVLVFFVAGSYFNFIDFRREPIEWFVTFAVFHAVWLLDLVALVVSPFRNVQTQKVCHDRATIVKSRKWMIALMAITLLPVDLAVWNMLPDKNGHQEPSSEFNDSTASIVFFVFRAIKFCRVLRVVTLFEVVNLDIIEPSTTTFFFLVKPLIQALCLSVAFTHLSCIVFMQLNSVPARDDYLTTLVQITSLYTGGGPSVDMSSSSEQMLALVSCIVFVVVQGVAIGQLSVNVFRNDVAANNLLIMRETLAIVKHYGVPEPIQTEILSYQFHALNDDVGRHMSNLATLPVAMQREVMIYVKVDAISRVKLFQNALNECKYMLAEELQAVIAEPDVDIVSIGDVGTEMYTIAHGYANVIIVTGMVVATLSRGDYFGEVALLLETCQRQATVRALTFCDLWVLSKESFLATLECYPSLLLSMADDIRAKNIDTTHLIPAIQEVNVANMDHDDEVDDGATTSQESPGASLANPDNVSRPPAVNTDSGDLAQSQSGNMNRSQAEESGAPGISQFTIHDQREPSNAMPTMSMIGSSTDGSTKKMFLDDDDASKRISSFSIDSRKVSEFDSRKASEAPSSLMGAPSSGRLASAPSDLGKQSTRASAGSPTYDSQRAASALLGADDTVRTASVFTIDSQQQRGSVVTVPEMDEEDHRRGGSTGVGLTEAQLRLLTTIGSVEIRDEPNDGSYSDASTPSTGLPMPGAFSYEAAANELNQGNNMLHLPAFSNPASGVFSRYTSSTVSGNSDNRDRLMSNYSAFGDLRASIYTNDDDRRGTVRSSVGGAAPSRQFGARLQARKRPSGIAVNESPIQSNESSPPGSPRHRLSGHTTSSGTHTSGGSGKPLMAPRRGSSAPPAQAVPTPVDSMAQMGSTEPTPKNRRGVDFARFTDDPFETGQMSSHASFRNANVRAHPSFRGLPRTASKRNSIIYHRKARQSRFAPGGGVTDSTSGFNANRRRTSFNVTRSGAMPIAGGGGKLGRKSVIPGAAAAEPSSGGVEEIHRAFVDYVSKEDRKLQVMRSQVQELLLAVQELSSAQSGSAQTGGKK